MKKDISGQGLLMSFFVRMRRQKKADAVADGHLLRESVIVKRCLRLFFCAGESSKIGAGGSGRG